MTKEEYANLLQRLAKANLMYVAAKTAISALRRILPMDEGISREKELVELLDFLEQIDGIE